MPDKEIMAIHRDILFSENVLFQGFLDADRWNPEPTINARHTYIKREIADNQKEGLDFKQPIAYIAIIKPEKYRSSRVFLYQRSKKDKDYQEKKLQGKLSIGLGGHIEKVDNKLSNPIRDSLFRELSEEVRILGQIAGPYPLGFLNDEKDDVGQRHIGLLYYVLTDANTIVPKAKEIENGRYITPNRLQEMCNDSKYNVEGWTKIAAEPIVKLLKDKSLIDKLINHK